MAWCGAAASPASEPSQAGTNLSNVAAELMGCARNRASRIDQAVGVSKIIPSGIYCLCRELRWDVPSWSEITQSQKLGAAVQDNEVGSPKSQRTHQEKRKRKK